MRSTLTRIGENSKMIITGDTKQIDIKKTIFVDTVIRMFSENQSRYTSIRNKGYC
jgi:phosphate starvation-inducible protein PhoH